MMTLMANIARPGTRRPILLLGLGWVTEADDVGWIVGDYAGHTARVDLTDPNFNTSGAWITTVDRIDDVWHVYDVAADGRTTELLTLTAANHYVEATRTTDGTHLYVQSGASDIDGGIDVVDLDTGALTNVLQGGPTPDTSRTGLFWSSSGQTLFSGLCALYRCHMDVIDADTGDARRLPKAFGAIAASDRYALGYESAEGPDRPWAIYDLKTDKVTTVADRWIAETEAGVPVGGDRFAVAGWSPAGHAYNIVLVDAGTGESQLVRSEPPSEYDASRLQRFLTGSRWVILSQTGPWEQLRRGGARSDVLDVDTGALLPSAAMVGP
jgi:hypothetical protein